MYLLEVGGRLHPIPAREMAKDVYASRREEGQGKSQGSAHRHEDHAFSWPR
jgi:hypothetical protein